MGFRRIGEAKNPGPQRRCGDEQQWMRDSWGCDYVQRQVFEGGRSGCIFATGPRGTGYYRDDLGAGACRAAAACERESWFRDFSYLTCFDAACDLAVLAGPFIIKLAEVIPTDEMQCPTGWRRPRVVPRRRRRRKPRRRVHRGHRDGHQAAAEPPPWVRAIDLGIAKNDCSHRVFGAWAVDTYNGNSAITSLAYLEHTGADIVLLQETRVRLARLIAAQRQAKRARWSLAAEPACLTDAGACSAGVAVATREHLGHAHARDDIDDTTLAGRLRVSHVAAVCRGGMHFLSAYFWCSEGISPRNIALLQAIARVIRGLHGPWLLAADFNFTPQVLRGTGWLELVQGTLWTPKAPTCNFAEYDYFVIDRRLDHAVLGVAVINDTGSRPHSAVRLWLREAPRRDRVRVLRRPGKAPALLPSGCATQAEVQRWEALAAALAAAPSTADLGAALDVALRGWIQTVEHSIADQLSLSTAERKRFCTRANGPKFVWRCALGPPGAACKRVSLVTVAWKISS